MSILNWTPIRYALILVALVLWLAVLPSSTYAQCDANSTITQVVGSSQNGNQAAGAYSTSCMNGQHYALWYMVLNTELCRGNIGGAATATQQALTLGGLYQHPGLITAPNGDPNSVIGPNQSYWNQMISFVYGTGAAPTAQYCSQVSGGNSGGSGGGGNGNTGGGQTGSIILDSNTSCQSWTGGGAVPSSMFGTPICTSNGKPPLIIVSRCSYDASGNLTSSEGSCPARR